MNNLTRTKKFGGYVRNSQGKPIGGASVFGYVGGLGETLRLTDNEGHFVFESVVVPGRYLIKAKASGYKIEGKSVDLTTSEKVFFSYDFVLSESDSSLSGRLLDDNNSPIAGAEIFLYHNDLVLAQTRSASESGAFSFPDLGEGRYELSSHALCHNASNWSGSVKGDTNVTLISSLIEGCNTISKCDVCGETKSVKYCRFCHAYICSDCKRNYPERIKAMLRRRFSDSGKDPEKFKTEYEQEANAVLSDSKGCCSS